ncbi:MAG: MMPL family transporter [Syntrophorhabdales bacterium]|jgi:predicted RND superfamily exporter protein
MAITWVAPQGPIRIHIDALPADEGESSEHPGRTSNSMLFPLTRGPHDLDEALKSPLWKRVLFSGDRKASFIYVWVKQHAPVEKGVQEIERIRQRLNSAEFPLIMSGAPYIIELIERNLLRDLKAFSIAALCVLGLSGLAISRSVVMVLGTLIACANASALTLVLTQTFGIPIGPLTANLSTIVFVLTLTHMVFMTFNWKHIIEKRETDAEKAWWRAVRVTVLPSFWSMLTALLGFLSLMSVPATPLRQLGISGAIGAVVAFASAGYLWTSSRRPARTLRSASAWMP